MKKVRDKTTPFFKSANEELKRISRLIKGDQYVRNSYTGSPDRIPLFSSFSLADSSSARKSYFLIWKIITLCYDVVPSTGVPKVVSLSLTSEKQGALINTLLILAVCVITDLNHTSCVNPY